jgi:RNA polymerase sigma-70 factor (ECF subfamily)
MSSNHWSEVKDGELVKACLHGDKKAYDELVNRYRNIIYALAAKHVGNLEVAKDITQDVLIDAYLGLAKLRDENKFGPWVKSITLNHCSDWRKRMSREELVDENVVSDSMSLDEDVERRELNMMIHRAISQLSVENQQTIRLFYFDGLSCRQVAEFLNSSPGAIRNRLHESIKRLRKELSNQTFSFPKRKSLIKKKRRGNYSKMGITQERERINIRFITQFGDAGQYVFGGKKNKLYAAIYPSCDLSDKPWEEIMDKDEAQRLLAQWESMQVISRTTRKIHGLIPICTPQDALKLRPWYDSFSNATAATVENHIGELRSLIDKFIQPDEVNNVLGIVVICWALGARTGPLTGSAFSAGDGRAERETGKRYACFGRATERFAKRDMGYVCRSYDDNYRWLGIHHGVDRSEFIKGVNRWGNYLGQESYRVFNTLIAIGGETISLPEFRYAAFGARVQKQEFDEYLNDLLNLHLIAEDDGRYKLAFPVLYHSQMEPVTDIAKSIAQEIVNQLADLVEDLRDIAAQCSFADCRFNDVFQMVWSEALSCALDILVESGLLPNWPESALGEWGVWLYCNT